MYTKRALRRQKSWVAPAILTTKDNTTLRWVFKSRCVKLQSLINSHLRLKCSESTRKQKKKRKKREKKAQYSCYPEAFRIYLEMRQVLLLTFLLPCLPSRHSENDQQKRQTWNHEGFVFLFACARQRISIKMCNIESRFVIGPSNVLSAGGYVCTFHPGNLTGCGSEGVKCLI